MLLLTRRLKVKAGVLLYALLMSAIFLLLLQFYVDRQLAAQRQHQAQLMATKAYAIALLTKEMADQPQGSFHFSSGQSRYEQEDSHLSVRVSIGQVERVFRFYHQLAEKSQKEETEQGSRTQIERADDNIMSQEQVQAAETEATSNSPE